MTLVDTLVSVVISGLVFAALATVVTVMLRTAPKVQTDVAEAHDVEQLMRYLPSDIASTPSAIGQFSTDPATPSGCAGPDEGVNALHLESTEIASGAAVSISYRIVPVSGGATTLVRVRCEGPDQASLGPPEIVSVADELDVGQPVEVEVVDDGVTVQRVSMTLRGTSGQRRLVSGAPSVAAAGLPAASTTTTLPPTTTAAATTTTVAATTTTAAATTTAGPTTTVAAPTTTVSATTTAAPTSTAAPTTTAASTSTTTGLPVCSANPFRSTAGFTAFVDGDLHLGSGDSYGPVAAGDDVSFGNYSVTPRSTTIGFKAPGETLATGLLVGDEIDWGLSLLGTLTVKDTPVHVDDFDNGVKGITLGAETRLLQWPGLSLLRSIHVTGLAQPLTGINGIERSDLLDFDDAFDALGTASASLATLPGTCAGAASVATFGVNGVGAWSGSGPVWLQYTAGRVNVFNSTVAQLEGMTNVNKTVASAAASASTTLLINVPDAGVIDFTPPVWTQNEPRFVIWNFPNATQITISGPLWGSLLAPNARVIGNADLRGNVVADSLRLNSGTLDWDRRYAGSFPWDPWVQP